MIFLAALFLSLQSAQAEAPSAEPLVLENGVTVLFTPPDAKKPGMRMHLCFPSGRVVEAVPGSTAACVGSLAEPEIPGAIPWIAEEISGVSFELSQGSEEATLSAIAASLWKSTPKADPMSWPTPISPTLSRHFEKEDFLSYMLHKSPYANPGKRNAAPLEFNDSLRVFRARLFHPRQMLLIVEAARTPSLETAIRRGLGVASNRPYSMFYSIVEEPVHLLEKDKILFDERLRSVRLAVVFPAPARGREDTIAFAALVGEARERFGEERVGAWSGLGTGLFWIEYETSVERYATVAPQFRSAIEDFCAEMNSTYEPHESLRSQDSRAQPGFERRWALRHYWGAGCDDWDRAQATAEEMKKLAASYLRRPASFVLWPQSRRDEWKGFP